MSAPFWISAFLDLAPGEHAAATGFWAAVTGYDVSPPRGGEGEFTTLVPPQGDDYLRVQRLGTGPSRIHLDLHVADPVAEAERAVALGATVLFRSPWGYVVLTSPGGLVLCLVTHPSSRRPAPRDWGGHLSLLDQVCLDIPEEHWHAERSFWAALLELPLRPASDDDSASALERPPGMPLRLLMQRLQEPTGPVRAHLDLATSDRAAETGRHRALGAVVHRVHEHWTVLLTPAAAGATPYCLTDRDPDTGLLA